MNRVVASLTLFAVLGLIDASAARAVLCKCGALRTTPTVGVSSSASCSDATANLSNELWNYITCDPCRQPTLTSSCTTIHGEDLLIFDATGYFTYRCYIVGGGCEIP